MPAANPFRHVQSGERLRGLPSEAWNKFIEGLKNDAPMPKGFGERFTPVDIPVLNETGAVSFDRFDVVGVTGVIAEYSEDSDQFFNNDVMTVSIAGSASPRSTIAVVQEPLVPQQIGRARLLGLTKCRVDLTDTDHRFAIFEDPDALNLTYLTSRKYGNAKLLWTESDFASTGEQWAVILLGEYNLDPEWTNISDTSLGSVSGTETTGALWTPTEAGEYSIVGGVLSFTFLPSSTSGHHQIEFVLAASDPAIELHPSSGYRYRLEEYYESDNAFDLYKIITFSARVKVIDPTVGAYIYAQVSDTGTASDIGVEGISFAIHRNSSIGITQMEGVTVGTTPVNGGTAAGVLYSDGATLQSAANTRIRNGKLEVKVAAGQWFSVGVESF